MSQQKNNKSNNGTMTNQQRQHSRLNLFVRIGMISALAVVLGAIEIPIIPWVPHLKYDPGDIPILVGAMFYGPLAGLFMSFFVSFVQSFLVHGSGGIFGFVMHFFASSTISMVVALIYRQKKGKRHFNLILALAIGSIAMTAVMAILNLFVTPLFMPDIPIDTIKKTIFPAVIPFNLLKAAINSLVAGILMGIIHKNEYLERYFTGDYR